MPTRGPAGADHPERASSAKVALRAGPAIKAVGRCEDELPRVSSSGTPLLDPMEVAARRALAIARGEAPLPS